jgi:hypothetical protein
MDVVLTLQLPRGDRFIPIAMTADIDVLRCFKRSVLTMWERELDLATDEVEALVRRNELDKLRRTLNLLIPNNGEGADNDQ